MSMSEAAGTLARVIAVRSPARGVVLIVAASGFFAVNGSVAKLVIQAGIGPAHLTTLRASGAFLALLGGVLVHDARRLAVRRQELATLVVFGLTGLFLVPMLYFVAISRLPVGIGLLFEYTAPLLVALWARFGQRRPVRTRLWGGLVLSLAGLACVAEVWGQVRLDRVGIAAGFGAAVLLAVYFVVGARGVADRDPLWLHCCYVVLLGSVVPYVLVAASLQHLPATSVGILGMIEPVIAATVAWLALDEVLSPAQLLGGMLVLAGVALAETARVAAPEPPHLPPG